MKKPFDAFYHVRIPTPVLLDPRVTRVESIVFGALWSAYLINGRKPVSISVSEVARRVKTKREHVRRAIEKFVSLDFVRIEGGRFSFLTRDVEGSEGQLIGGGKGRRATPDAPRDDGHETDEGWPARGQGGGPPGARLGGPPRATNRSPIGVPIGTDRASPCRDASYEPPDEDRRLTSTADNVAATARAYLDAMRSSDVASDEEASPEAVPDERPRRTPRKRRRRESSGDEFATTPSKRWEFAEAPEAVSSWSARHLVGYYARRHLDVVGTEAEELRFANLDVPEARRLIANVRRFVATWLEGNPAFAKKAIDDVLRLSRNRSLRYFFTPRSDEALRRLTSAVKGSAQKQIDNADGVDVEKWRRRAAERRGAST